MASRIINIPAMMPCIVPPDSMWEDACGIRSTIREVIIRILSTEESWTISDSRSIHTICLCRSVLIQKNPSLIADSGPMVYIANAMTPFSPADVTIYSNCDSVTLTYNKGGKVYTYAKAKNRVGMPSPIITFKDVFHVMDDKELSRQKKQSDSYLLARGYVDGKLVATHREAYPPT